MSLLSTLVSSAGALRAFDQTLEVTQNNVANAATPGFVKQRQILLANPFDPETGFSGGVRAAEVQNARNEYVEQSVRRQTVLLGQSEQSIASLTALESIFDISGNAGIPAALTNLFQSFSAWAQSPTDRTARQTVIERASDLAGAFHQTWSRLTEVAHDSERQIQDTVETINTLAGQLQAYNVRALAGNRLDPALDAGVHATLEELSQYGDITALYQEDGSVTVLLNGQTPLVVADRQYDLTYRLEQPVEPPPINAGGRPLARIYSSDGVDVTSHTTGGKLGALLDFRNGVLPTYLGDAYQDGDLNRMAGQFADRVNELLTSGNISEGPPPVPGIALFTYDAANPTAIAQTLAINPLITADQLAASAPGPPPVSNGVALALSGLSHPQSPLDEIDGIGYVEFYGSLAARAGHALSDARTEAEVQQSAVAQAKNLREQLSGVSLDEEATIMIQFQRAYEANSRLIAVLDDLTRTIIDMVRT